jgi:translocator protein
MVLVVVGVVATAVLGGLGSQDAPQFYGQLTLPRWAPPAGVFGPVWTALYLAMALAGCLVAQQRVLPRAALGLFFAQLVVNTAWSWLFFYWHSGMLAMLDIVLLDALVVATIAAFWRLRPIAAVLLLPYLAWIAFATALTWSVWQRNPGLLG